MRFLFTRPQRASWPLLASFAMNLALLAALIVVWQGQKKTTPSVAIATAVHPAQPAGKGKAPAVKATPFHWRQLDAADFATYVKNLRAIGCPELTIQDILAGELEEIYAQKRQVAAASSTGSLLEAEMFKLNTEQERWLTQLTAPASVSTPSTIQSSAGTAAAASPVAAGKSAAGVHAVVNAVSVPAAFTYGTQASSALKQNGGQVMLTSGGNETRLPPAATATLQQMQQDFVSALGDTVQQPDSPLYRQRWNAAQRDSDEQFSSLFGGDAFVNTQSEAMRAAAVTSK